MPNLYFQFDGTGSGSYDTSATTLDPDNIYVEVTEGAANSGNTYWVIGDSFDNLSIEVPENWTISFSAFPGPINEYLVRDDNDDLAIIFRTNTLVDDQNIICFTAGSRVRTPRGLRLIEDIKAGDLVFTRDHGAQTVRWVGQTVLSAETIAARPELRPVRLDRDALGKHNATAVSPGHRIMLSGWQAEALFGAAEVLVPARMLINDTTIGYATPDAPVEYIHVMFDRHELIEVDGLWSESFHPEAIHAGMAGKAAVAEVLAIFPDLESGTDHFPSLERTKISADHVSVLNLPPPARD